MRALVYRGPGRVELATDLPMPVLTGDRDAIVRVTRAAICGTDLHPFRGEIPTFAPGTVLGHEFVGIVEAAGTQVPISTGTRVVAADLIACGRCPSCARGWHYQCADVSLFGYSTVVGRPVDGGQAEFVRVPYADTVLSRCPDGLPDEQMLFVGDVLSTGYAAAAACGIVAGDVVGVVGAGPVGLLAAMCARISGAAHVVLADVDERRRGVAESFGFRAVPPALLAEALRDAAGTAGAAAVIDAVGTAAALDRAVASACPRGTVVVVGAPNEAIMPLAAQAAFARELTIRFAVGDPIRDRDQVVNLLLAGRLDPAAIVSHRIPLADAAWGYELFDRRDAFKVVLLPEG